MGLKRVQHVSVSIEAGREDEARRFYGDILGLCEKPLPLGLAGRPFIWYAVGEDESEIHLIRTAPESFTASRPGDHLCIETDDLGAMHRGLEARGVVIRPASAIDNRPRFFVADPFGNRIEIVQIEGSYTPVAR